MTLKVAFVPDPEGAEEFYREQFAQFTKENPRIKIDAVSFPGDQIVNAVQLMFQQGEGPDLYRAQGRAVLKQFVDRGWAAQLNDYVDDDFTARYADGAFNPALSGLHLDGQLYSLPLAWSKWTANGMFIYNKELLSDAGYPDPPSTWSQLQEVARAITSKGKGNAYGFAPGSGNLAGLAQMQATGGPYSIGSLFGIDLRDGTAATSHSSLTGAVDLHKALAAEQVMTPGWEAWKGDRAYTEFAKERLGMYIGGSYHVNVIRELNNDIDMGITTIPAPDSGRGGYIGVRSSFQPIWSMSAETEYPEEAWQVMDFLGSEKFQRAYFERFRSFTAIEDFWRNSDLTEDERSLVEAHDSQDRPVPDPEISGSAGAQQLMANLREQQELNYQDQALPAVLRNEDYMSKATDLDEKITAFLAAESDRLAKDGVEVSLADLAFPSWDPLEPWAPVEN